MPSTSSSSGPVISEYLAAAFPDFEPPLREVLASHSILKQVPAGEVIIRTGQYLNYTLLIAAGKVKLYREGSDGEEAFIYYLDPGNACALSMICNTRRETSEIMARAVEDTVLLLVPVELMDDLVRQYKTWFHFVVGSYRARFEELLEVLDNVLFKGMDERLEFYLQNLFKSRNTNEIAITHQEIANDLNTSREVISRLLKKMEQNKKIGLYRNNIVWQQ